MTRRRLLGLTAAAPALAIATAACSHGEVIPPPAPRTPNLVWTNWLARPNGPIPALGDEGQPLHVYKTHPAMPVVDRGALIGALPPQQAATYVGQDLTIKVSRLGAVFGFEPGSARGSLGLITLVQGGRLTGHIHLAISPDEWTASTFDDGRLDTLDSQDFDPPLAQDRRPYRVDVVVDGATTSVALPDGSGVRFGSEAVASIRGTVACWEFFQERAGGAQARLYQSWAG